MVTLELLGDLYTRLYILYILLLEIKKGRERGYRRLSRIHFFV